MARPEKIEPRLARDAAGGIDLFGFMGGAAGCEQTFLDPVKAQGGKAGQAGPVAQHAGIKAAMRADMAAQGRAGADEAHVAAQDVVKLRQLVKAGAAQGAPKPRDARRLVAALSPPVAPSGSSLGRMLRNFHRMKARSGVFIRSER